MICPNCGYRGEITKTGYKGIPTKVGSELEKFETWNKRTRLCPDCGCKVITEEVITPGQEFKEVRFA